MKSPSFHFLYFNNKVIQKKKKFGRGNKADCASEFCFLVSRAFEVLIFEEGAGCVLQAGHGCCSTHKNLLDQKITECRGWQTVLL